MSHDINFAATVELVRHRKRLAVDRHDGWVCKCGQWKGRNDAEFNQHVAAAVVDAIGGFVGDDLARTLARKTPDDPSNLTQAARRDGFADAFRRVGDLFAGCTCRPGLVLGSMGCQVEGHDTSDGDLE